MRGAIAVVVVLASAVLAAPGAEAAQPSVRAWVEPARPSFGDTFSYVVEVVVDEPHGEAVRVLADAGPFTTMAEPRTTRVREDGVVRIRVTQTLACLSASCVPRAAARTIALPRARVDGVGVARLEPVVVRMRPRVSAAAVRADDPAFRRPMKLETPTSRLPAWALVSISLALATVVLLLPVALARSRRRIGSGRLGPVDPVARAVRLLRESVRRPAPDRRRAASLAARVVTEQGLADDAARIAWSRRIPGEDAAGDLADRIERGRSRTS